MAHTQISTLEKPSRAVERSYPLQSKLYGATQWAFLFGRRRLIRSLPFPIEKQAKILEVGCGAGHNLQQLARWFPNAVLTGMDASSDRLGKARQATAEFRNRVELIQEPYGQGSEHFNEKLDAILFSYSLTLANPRWKELIRRAAEDLRPGGIIAVVDFHDSRFSWFKAHMSNHHVRMDGHLLPFLNREFKPLASEVSPAYWGLWEYFSFVGRKE